MELILIPNKNWVVNMQEASGLTKDGVLLLDFRLLSALDLNEGIKQFVLSSVIYWAACDKRFVLNNSLFEQFVVISFVDWIAQCLSNT